MADFKVTAKSEPTSGRFFIGESSGSLYMGLKSGRRICVVAKNGKIQGHIYEPSDDSVEIKPGSILTIEV